MKRISLLLPALILINAIVAFALNILANKVSELVFISDKFLPWITVTTICLAYILGLIFDYYEDKIKNLQSLNILDILTSRVITIFFTSIGMGIIVGYLCHLLIPIQTGFTVFHSSFLTTTPYNYEIIGFITGVGVLYFLKRARNNLVLSITYSIGFGMSLGLVFYELYPKSDGFFYVLLIPTLITWCLLFISCVIVMHTNAVKVFFEYFSTTINFFTKVR